MSPMSTYPRVFTRYHHLFKTPQDYYVPTKWPCRFVAFVRYEFVLKIRSLLKFKPWAIKPTFGRLLSVVRVSKTRLLERVIFVFIFLRRGLLFSYRHLLNPNLLYLLRSLLNVWYFNTTGNLPIIVVPFLINISTVVLTSVYLYLFSSTKKNIAIGE